jgi:hypothetical protein
VSSDCAQTSTAVRGHEEGVTLGGALQEVRKIVVVPTFLIIILQVAPAKPKCKPTTEVFAVCQ